MTRDEEAKTQTLWGRVLWNLGCASNFDFLVGVGFFAVVIAMFYIFVVCIAGLAPAHYPTHLH
jgi:hypothetical protein